MKSAPLFEREEELEIEPRDILIETYAEPASIDIDLEAPPSASLPPSAPAPSAPAPEPPYPMPLPPTFALAWSEAPSSLAPFAVSTSIPEAAPLPIDVPSATPVPKSPSRSGVVVTVASLVATALLAGIVVSVALAPGSFARARTAVAQRLSHVRHDESVRAVSQAAAPPLAPSEPAPAPATAPMPTPSVAVDALPSLAIAVDALPSPSIEPNMTLVTFRKAKKHRVFVDGRVLAAATEPVKLKCGKHKIRSGGMKGRMMDLPCGGELTVD